MLWQKCAPACSLHPYQLLSRSEHSVLSLKKKTTIKSTINNCLEQHRGCGQEDWCNVAEALLKARCERQPCTAIKFLLWYWIELGFCFLIFEECFTFLLHKHSKMYKVAKVFNSNHYVFFWLFHLSVNLRKENAVSSLWLTLSKLLFISDNPLWSHDTVSKIKISK